MRCSSRAIGGLRVLRTRSYLTRPQLNFGVRLPESTRENMKEDPRPVLVQERPLVCQHCGHGLFRTHTGLIHGAAASIFGFEWAAPEAACHVCAACGYVHWFMKEKQHHRGT